MNWSGEVAICYASHKTRDREEEEQRQMAVCVPVAPIATTRSSFAGHPPLIRTDKLARYCDAG